MTTRPASPLDGVVVLEDSHTVAGAHAGKLMRQLGATVYLMSRGERPCGSCDVPVDAATGLDTGKHDVVDGVPGTVDIVLTDEDCCLRDGVRNVHPTTRDHADRAGLVGRIQHASSSDPRRGEVSALGACAEAGVSIALGRPGQEPLGLPPGVAETVAGTNLIAAVLAGWLGRAGVLGPLEVSISTADCLEFFVGMNSKMYEGYPREWERSGRRASGSAGPYPAAIFRCKDGFVGIIGRSRSDWRGLVAAMGDPDWASVEQMQDPWYISEHLADEVDIHVQNWTDNLTEAELIDLAMTHGFVIAPIRAVDEVLRENQHHLRDFWEINPGTERANPGRAFVVTRPEDTSAKDQSGCGEDRTKVTGPSVLKAGPSRLLEDIRVLDLSWVWAGPMVTMVLADLGAEVIKVEHPSRPDGSRTRGRPTRNGVPVEGPELEVTPYFHQVNHGKYSLGIDLKDKRAQSMVRDIARSCDVVVENMRPGVMDRLGLGYSSLSALNDQIIMLSMTLAGQRGPLAQLKGYAPVMGGLAGLEGLLGYPDDDVTGMYTFSFCDPNGASHGLVALLGALIERQRTGLGSWIDLSQIEAAIAALPLQISRPTAARPTGNRDERYAYQATVRCHGNDEWLAITAATTQQLVALKGIVGAGTNDVDTAIRSWAHDRTVTEAHTSLRAAGIPCSPVLRWPSVLARRDASGPSQSLTITHPYGGPERIHTPPWRYDTVAPANPRRAPLLGEHTNDILAGLNSETLHVTGALTNDGVLCQSHRPHPRSDAV